MCCSNINRAMRFPVAHWPETVRTCRSRELMMPRTLGLEIEMPVAACDTGASHKVGHYFHALARSKQLRGEKAEILHLQQQAVAVCSPFCKSGLDNAFNNLESSIGPFAEEDPLDQLHKALCQELQDVARALAEEPQPAMVINFSEHPCVHVTDDFYYGMRTPKPSYDYIVRYRGWKHMAGVDAKAHNGPTTGATPAEAALGLNVLLAASACFIALYANSPFEAGSPTGLLENRLTIWPRMFASSRFACDLKLSQMPERPFLGWADYFHWMYGPGTCMMFLAPAGSADYKTSASMLQAEGDPSLLEFLQAPSWPGRVFQTGEPVRIRPDMRHLEFLQFSNALDCRLRFALHKDASLQTFLANLQTCLDQTPSEPEGQASAFWEHGEPPTQEQQFCEFFATQLQYVYLEGRAPGANLPDRELASLDDASVPASVASSASALQLGLCNRLEQARRLLARHPWRVLRQLREEAARHGLDAVCEGVRVDTLCHELLELAAEGLQPEQRWLLAYPRHVLQTRQSGATRALAAFERMSGSPQERLLRLVRERGLVPL